MVVYPPPNPPHECKLPTVKHFLVWWLHPSIMLYTFILHSWTIHSNTNSITFNYSRDLETSQLLRKHCLLASSFQAHLVWTCGGVLEHLRTVNGVKDTFKCVSSLIKCEINHWTSYIGRIKLEKTKCCLWMNNNKTRNKNSTST